MSTVDLTPFADVDWPSLQHQAARAWLEDRGWTLCGEGDWALAIRSPDGRMVARVSAFEPSYGWFVELCRRTVGNPSFPQIHLVTNLEGGGQLAVLDCLTPVTGTDEAAFRQRWNDETDPDPDLVAAREASRAPDAQCRATAPFWMGIDLDDQRHARRRRAHPAHRPGRSDQGADDGADLYRPRRVLPADSAREVPPHARHSVLRASGERLRTGTAGRCLRRVR
jgi:hypothetical protein